MKKKNITKSTLPSNVISLRTYQLIRKQRWEEFPYRFSLKHMTKPELLQELLKYQDKFKNEPKEIKYTVRGQFIMEALEQRSELDHLRKIANEFNNKLKIRLYEQVQNLEKITS